MFSMASGDSARNQGGLWAVYIRGGATYHKQGSLWESPDDGADLPSRKQGGFGTLP